MDQKQSQVHETTQQFQQSQTLELHQLQDQVQKMDLQLRRMSEKVDTVLVYMVGNELDTETGGMIKKFATQEKRIRDLEKFRDRMIWFLTGASVLGGFGLSKVIEIFK